jgi:beta-N-acetylhexosaminidase
VLDGLAEGGVVGIVKHIPGHGRSMSDSHVELPVVNASEEDLETDLGPFRTLHWAPMGMTSHVVYTAWDGDNCASLSSKVIAEIIRGRIGFDGFLMSDDLGMHALSGDFGARARGVVDAGCDVGLHCSGIMEEMVAVASAVEEIRSESRERLDRAMAIVAKPGESPPFEELVARRDSLLAYA